jgi:glycosyltransferase involved in cell wall biosynthesis
MEYMISILILTYNEEKNIKQCLESLKDFSDDIYILDSYSDDKTVEFTKSYLNDGNILYRKFDNYSNQRNWALRNIKFKNEWLLMLDADEILTDEVKASITKEIPNVNADVLGFIIKLKMHFINKDLRYRLWPLKRKTLFRHREVAFFRDINEHLSPFNTKRYKWETLGGYLIHKDNKTLHDYIAKHNHYSTMEAFRILQERNEPINWKKVRQISELKKIFYRLPFRNLAYFIYLYIFKLGILDGSQGFRFILLRVIYQFEIDIKIREIKAKGTTYEEFISFKK